MTGRGQRQLKINITKKEKKQLIFVWSLAYNLSDLSGPTRNIKVPADLACKIIISTYICTIIKIMHF